MLDAISGVSRPSDLIYLNAFARPSLRRWPIFPWKVAAMSNDAVDGPLTELRALRELQARVDALRMRIDDIDNSLDSIPRLVVDIVRREMSKAAQEAERKARTAYFEDY